MHLFACLPFSWAVTPALLLSSCSADAAAGVSGKGVAVVWSGSQAGMGGRGVGDLCALYADPPPQSPLCVPA